MKIKYVKIEARSINTFLNIWLMLPDFYTFYYNLGVSDRNYLNLCWKGKKLEEIDEFMKGYRLSLCRGSITIGARGKAPNKKLSWTWFGSRVYAIWTELNTPYPKPRPTNSPIKFPREIPISRTQHVLTLLPQIPSRAANLKDYVALYILKRDHGKNFLL